MMFRFAWMAVALMGLGSVVATRVGSNQHMLQSATSLTSTASPECSFDNDKNEAPFSFFLPNGSAVDPVCTPSNNYHWPSPSCTKDGTVEDCCKLADWAKNDSNMSNNIVTFVSLAVLIIFIQVRNQVLPTKLTRDGPDGGEHESGAADVSKTERGEVSKTERGEAAAAQNEAQQGEIEYEYVDWPEDKYVKMQFPHILFALVYGAQYIFFNLRKCCRSEKKRVPKHMHLEEARTERNPGALVTKDEPLLQKKQEHTDDKKASKSGYSFLLTKLFFTASILAMVLAPIFIFQAYQQAFSVSQRSAQLNADAFLTPFQEVFVFLEDTMTVRINYAIAMQDFEEVNMLVNVGTIAALSTGTLAGAVGSLLQAFDGSLDALVNPGSGVDNGDYAGCALISTSAEVRDLIRPYWLLQIWKWPALFVVMVLNGLFLGAFRFEIWAIATVCGVGLSMLIFLVPFADQDLELLGWAFWQVPFTMLAVYAAFILASPKFREKYCLRFMSWTDAASRKLSDKHKNSPTSRRIVFEGLKALTIDLTVQMAITIGVYVAAIKGGESTSYQISALQSAIPTYGTAWTLGIGLYFTKIFGSQFMAAKRYDDFKKLVILVMVVGICFAAIAVGAVLGFVQPVGFSYATNGCEFGGVKDDHVLDFPCLKLYNNIFTGAEGIQRTMALLAFSATSVCIYNCTKGSLYACLDFTFMAIASTIATILVFVPAICIAVFVYDASPASIYVAMYLPQTTLAILFMGRLIMNIRKMERGESGPWST